MTEIVDMLETQNTLLKHMASQCFAVNFQPAPLSKGYLLKFVKNIEEFLNDFVAVNERQIVMRKPPEEQPTEEKEITNAEETQG